METPIQTILNMLVEPPGNLIYHLVLLFSVVSALQAAVIGRQNTPYPHARRLIFGLGMLLLGQALLFASSGLAWQNVVNPDDFLPAMGRAVLLFNLVWIVWLWNFPRPARLGDLVTGFLVLGVVLFFLFAYSALSTGAGGSAFDVSTLDLVWEVAALAVTLTGMAVLLFSRPPGWGFGLGMLSLSLAGFVAHMLLTPEAGHLSGYIRLGQLAAFPLLTTLLHRFSAPRAQETERAQETPPQRIDMVDGIVSRLQERRRYSASARSVRAWLDLKLADEPEKIISGVARAVAHTMLSDLCFIVSGPSYGHLVLQKGYDLIREEEMQGTMLDQSALPALAGAINRGKALRITSGDSQPQDMKTLSTALGLNEAGSIMFIPLSADDHPQGGLLLLSPYSDRQWSQDDQSYLASELELIARVLRRAQEQMEKSSSAEQVTDGLRAEIETLRRQNQELREDLEDLRALPAVPAAQPASAVEINALVALQQESQEQIGALQTENERLRALLKSAGSNAIVAGTISADEFTQMEADLRTTLQELAILQNQLAISNARVLELERSVPPLVAPAPSQPNEDHEVITSLVQEIRQPMSSILGYTDLLLAESVGILGALQRKFLERIKASTERMHGILNDLIHITALGEGSIALLQQPVEMSAVIDDAVADTSAQLREKNITLEVDLPAEMPQVFADRDAIQQIVMHLLQNAGAATPQEGAITLRGRVTADEGRDYLLIQVTDTGGGIPTEDLPRVFTRRFRANMPLVQGLGDTGVGLSIARTLVEAHGGRIWVESVPGQTTTFSVLLPMRPGNGDSGE